MLEEAKKYLGLKTIGYIIGGSLIYSVGFNCFILPCSLYNGGFLGIAQLLIYFLESVLQIRLEGENYMGIIYLLMNIPLVYFAYKEFGHDFLIKSIFCICSYSFFLSAVPVPEVSYLPDNITACVAGGIFCGLGCAMTLTSKGSGGGEGILALLLMRKYSSLNLGTVFNIINFFVFGSCCIIYDISTAVYSAFFAVITAVVLDKTYLPSITVNMFIISKKENIENIIFDCVQRGVTKVKGVGAYSGEETNVLLTVVSKAEANVLRKRLLKFDENIFIIEDQSVSVVGNFKKRL